MEMRENTKRTYLAFLQAVSEQKGVFNMRSLIAEHAVDVKFMSFLKDMNLTLRVKGDEYKLNPAVTFRPPFVFEDFIVFRDTIEEQRKARMEVRQSHIPTTPPPSPIPEKHEPTIQRLIDRAVEEAKRKLAKDAADYAEWAVQKGKPVAETVYKMLTM